MKFVIAAATGALLAGLPNPSWAETDTIRFAQQQSIGYLQFDVLKHQHTLEKKAAALGVPDLKVTWNTFSGPTAQNDALLSGSVDVVSGGVPGLLTIWARTRGTAQEVRGITALSESSSKLNCNDPEIKTLRDLKPTSRIALPAVKVSIQAVVLQMAAANEFGADQWAKFDSQTTSLSPADTSAGLLAGGTGFDCGFTPPPFPYLQLRSPKIHTILDSADVTGSTTASVAWTSKRFREANPKVMQALVESLIEASDFINAHREEALAYYIEDSHSPLTIADLLKVTTEPHASFGIVPHGITMFGAVMAKTGSLKSAPVSWKDAFFSDIGDIAGD